MNVNVDCRGRRRRLLLNLGCDNLIRQLRLLDVQVDDSLRRIGFWFHIDIDGLVGEDLRLWCLNLDVDIGW